jgi:hypothetical protein
MLRTTGSPGHEPPPEPWHTASVIGRTPWSAALDALGRIADEIDRGANLPADPPVDTGDRRGAQPGPVAALWALAKTGATLGTLPLSIPLTAVAARAAQLEALARMEAYPEHLRAVAAGGVPVLDAPRTGRAPSERRYLLTSDLHRCIPGRLDWPARQRVKGLYREVLEHYADDEWDLVENGDVEDFWMVGGSTWGAVYDVGRLATGAAGRLADPVRTGLLREHLDRIVDNNAAVYATIRDGFCRDGRYHRTMGNHDDSLVDRSLCERLADHLPGTEVVDTLLLTRNGAGDADGIAGVDAVVAHGHLTDAWNGPGLALLGRAITWLATGLDDLPRRSTVEGLPDPRAVTRLLEGRARNRLITLDPRFGGNRQFDSLDEQRLFHHLAQQAPDPATPDGGWPWLVFGHTHFPMLRPLDGHGRPARYANSGCGILDGAVSALEWHGDRDPDDALVLVVWVDDDDGPRRIELRPDGDSLTPA